jgi:hypothetical protein
LRQLRRIQVIADPAAEFFQVRGGEKIDGLRVDGGSELLLKS